MPLAGEEKRAYMRRRYAEDPKRFISQASKRWHEKEKFEPQKNWVKRLKVRYNMTVEQYEAMLEFQSGKCALCGGGKPIDIDHNHDTGRVRGLLCRSCNVGLGQLGDSIDGLKRAIAYLERTDCPFGGVGAG